MIVSHLTPLTASTERIYLNTRLDWELFNLSRLKAKTKVQEALIRNLLFACDAALPSHSEEQSQSLRDHCSQAPEDFSLTISLKKTNMMGQEGRQPPLITVNNYELEVVHQLIYLGSTTTDSFSLDAEINK